ncbi:MAG: hypothetical protein WBL84_02685, partial [Xanthobacteraceae bacterium]
STNAHCLAMPVRKKSLIVCPKCKLEMRLVGVEAESATRDLYTFECERCGLIEVRGLRIK